MSKYNSKNNCTLFSINLNYFMKLLFLILFTNVVTFSALSQTDTTTKKNLEERYPLSYNNALKLDGRFVIGDFILSYERFLNRSNSIICVGRYGNYLYDGNWESYITTFQFQYRHYFSKRDKRGYYLGTSLGVGYTTYLKEYRGQDPTLFNTYYAEEFRFSNIALTTGYQLKLKSRWVVDLGIQINYNYWLEMRSPFTNGYESTPYSDNRKLLYYQRFLTLNLGFFF